MAPIKPHSGPNKSHQHRSNESHKHRSNESPNHGPNKSSENHGKNKATARLQAGSTGKLVLKLEEALQEIPKYKFPGEADEFFDPGTTESIKRLEREHGFYPNGIVGRRVQRVLGMLPAKASKPLNSEGSTDFKVGSINVLGSSHTTANGNKPGYASGPQRMRMAVDAIKDKNLSVVGFQELEPNQLKQFHESTNNKFGVFPGTKLGARETSNSLAWDKSKWDLVEAKTIDIPYFDGNKRPMPVVLLRNKETGQPCFFTNFHNPADTKKHPNQARFREKATQLEMALVNKLERKTGIPVIMTGDMNEKNSQEYKTQIKNGTSMHAAIDGKSPNTQKQGVDWIFGTDSVEFSDYSRDYSPRVSDHSLISSNVSIDPTGPTHGIRALFNEAMARRYLRKLTAQ
jgi:endonuclease/exonuclease/phosphatase family metal-dependent hydrolase